MATKLKRVAKETVKDLGMVFSNFRKSAKKRSKKIPQLSGMPPLAFAVIPGSVTRPEPLRRKLTKRKRRRR